ncbi:MAG TPA: N-acetyl-gamma-glutamyl-phosphate reductase [Lachnospiraceae bacterium]|nr:N-acetyl-gamma-glutamyl-phosphate reductase [Lachnospiraceae bacterium]
MPYKVFVDGQSGTTGLRINDYLCNRSDIELLKIDQHEHKNPEVKRTLINASDIVFLCLPDSAARDSVSLLQNDYTRVIDASTAHRTNQNWVYGLPELNKDQRNRIKEASKVSVPGCHATGFVTSLYPLIQNGIVPTNYPITCSSLTGYSGGGKERIHNFENNEFSNINSPKHYALNLNHKHIPEMTAITGLLHQPIFTPIISNYYKGLVTTIPLHTRMLNRNVCARDVHSLLSEYYADEILVKVMPFEEDSNLECGFLNTEGCINTDRLEIFVYGNEKQILVMARLDNLGKGASGAAIQNMNIMLGVDELTGLKY